MSCLWYSALGKNVYFYMNNIISQQQIISYYYIPIMYELYSNNNDF